MTLEPETPSATSVAGAEDSSSDDATKKEKGSEEHFEDDAVEEDAVREKKTNKEVFSPPEASDAILKQLTKDIGAKVDEKKKAKEEPIAEDAAASKEIPSYVLEAKSLAKDYLDRPHAILQESLEDFGGAIQKMHEKKEIEEGPTTEKKNEGGEDGTETVDSHATAAETPERHIASKNVAIEQVKGSDDILQNSLGRLPVASEESHPKVGSTKEEDKAPEAPKENVVVDEAEDDGDVPSESDGPSPLAPLSKLTQRSDHLLRSHDIIRTSFGSSADSEEASRTLKEESNSAPERSMTIDSTKKIAGDTTGENVSKGEDDEASVASENEIPNSAEHRTAEEARTDAVETSSVDDSSLSEGDTAETNSDATKESANDDTSETTSDATKKSANDDDTSTEEEESVSEALPLESGDEGATSRAAVAEAQGVATDDAAASASSSAEKSSAQTTKATVSDDEEDSDDDTSAKDKILDQVTDTIADGNNGVRASSPALSSPVMLTPEAESNDDDDEASETSTAEGAETSDEKNKNAVEDDGEEDVPEGSVPIENSNNDSVLSSLTKELRDDVVGLTNDLAYEEGGRELTPKQVRENADKVGAMAQKVSDEVSNAEDAAELALTESRKRVETAEAKVNRLKSDVARVEASGGTSVAEVRAELAEAVRALQVARHDEADALRAAEDASAAVSTVVDPKNKLHTRSIEMDEATQGGVVSDTQLRKAIESSDRLDSEDAKTRTEELDQTSDAVETSTNNLADADHELRKALGITVDADAITDKSEDTWPKMWAALVLFIVGALVFVATTFVCRRDIPPQAKRSSSRGRSSVTTLASSSTKSADDREMEPVARKDSRARVQQAMAFGFDEGRGSLLLRTSLLRPNVARAGAAKLSRSVDTFLKSLPSISDANVYIPSIFDKASADDAHVTGDVDSLVIPLLGGDHADDDVPSTKEKEVDARSDAALVCPQFHELVMLRTKQVSGLPMYGNFEKFALVVKSEVYPDGCIYMQPHSHREAVGPRALDADVTCSAAVSQHVAFWEDVSDDVHAKLLKMGFGLNDSSTDRSVGRVPIDDADRSDDEDDVEYTEAIYSRTIEAWEELAIGNVAGMSEHSIFFTPADRPLQIAWSAVYAMILFVAAAIFVVLNMMVTMEVDESQIEVLEDRSDDRGDWKSMWAALALLGVTVIVLLFTTYRGEWLWPCSRRRRSGTKQTKDSPTLLGMP